MLKIAYATKQKTARNVFLDFEKRRKLKSNNIDDLNPIQSVLWPYFSQQFHMMMYVCICNCFRAQTDCNLILLSGEEWRH